MSEKKNKKLRNKKILIGITILFVLAFIVYFIIDSQSESTDDAYIEADIIQVTPKVSGHIVETYIKDNMEVQKGDLVAKIDDAMYLQVYNQAQANYERALSNQKNAKATLAAKDSEVNLARIDLERYTKLYNEGAVSRQTLDKAKTNYQTVLANQTKAKEDIFSDGKSVADADLKALEAIRNQARLNLEYTRVIAPNTGTITNRRIEKGSFVSVGSPLFAIVPDKIWVVANFKENQVGKMKPGQEVEIKVDAYKNKTFKGHIDSIQRASSLFPPENAVGSFVKIVQRIPVKIVFDEMPDKSEYNIVSGMSVVPKVRLHHESRD